MPADERNVTDADKECPEKKSVSEKRKHDIKTLGEGALIGKNWSVVRSIDPEKGVNTIYVAKHTAKDKMAAVKIEKKGDKLGLLKFELFILLKMESTPNAKHFCKVFERGQTDEFNWIAVNLCGKNLKGLRHELPNARMSLPTGLSCAHQCLVAIEELHKLGFVHRCVNPTTFAVGRIQGDDISDLRNIYILDYGYARQYRDPDGKHKAPRNEPWTYLGTLRHAPRNAYLGREFSRADDMEMWYYMIVELVKGSLPWVPFRHPKDVFEYQKKVRNGMHMKEMLGGLPIEFVDMMKEVDKLAYADDPSYRELDDLLAAAMRRTGKPEFPYDWEAAEIAAAKEGPKKEEKDSKKDEPKK